MESVKRKKRLKSKRLATKIAWITSIMLVIIFILQIAFTVLSTSKGIGAAVNGQFSAISKANGQQVQEIIDAAAKVTDDIEAYLEKAYEMGAAGYLNMSGEKADDEHAAEEHGAESIIYQVPISELNSNVEQYITASASRTAATNPDIYAVGVMFEPYKYDKNIRDYAFYITEKDGDQKIEPYGTYEEYSTEEFYTIAKASKEAIFTEPYEYDGIMMVTCAKPIIFQNELQGVVMADINVTNFSKIETKNDAFPTMYATIFDTDGTVVYDSEDPVNINHDMKEYFTYPEEYDMIRQKMSEGKVFGAETTREDGRKVSRYYYPIQAGNENWWALSALDSKDLNKSVTTTAYLLIFIAVLALAVIVGVLVAVLRRTLAPIKSVVEAAQAISAGNLDVHLTADSEDEVGQLSKAFDTTVQGLRAIIADETYLLGEMAKGNFNVKTTHLEFYKGDFEPLLLSMRHICVRLSETLLQINEASEQVSSGSDQVSGGAQALSQGATEQASSVQELAATINEISTQIQKNAQSAQDANQKASVVENGAVESNARMQEMLSAMSEIDSSSNEIGKIIKTIEDIAFQTNILALNAAVEAARAGVAGKGFAVVADEVRNLASKSAEASKNTSALIENSLQSVKNGAKIADETAEALGTVVSGIKEVASIVDKISEASVEQAQSVAQVTQGIDQISSVVQTNSATAEESAAASEELSGQAQMLKQLVTKFQLKVGEESNQMSDAYSAVPEMNQAFQQKTEKGGMPYTANSHQDKY